MALDKVIDVTSIFLISIDIVAKDTLSTNIIKIFFISEDLVA